MDRPAYDPNAQRLERQDQQAFLDYYFRRTDIPPDLPEPPRNPRQMQPQQFTLDGEVYGSKQNVQSEPLNLDDFLQALFGSQYGSGEMSREKLRSADDLPKVDVRAKSTAPKSEPKQVEPEIIRPAIPVEKLLSTIFGDRYGSGEVSCDNLRDMSDFEIVMANLAKDNSDPVKANGKPEPRVEEPLRERVEVGAFLGSLFGANYGTGEIDKSRLRSVDELPVIDLSQPSKPTAVKSEPPPPPPKASVEMGAFLSGLFGTSYGSGSIDQSQLRSIEDLPTIETIMAAMNQAVQAAATVKPIERKPTSEVSSSKPSKPEEPFVATGNVKLFLSDLFGEKYGSGEVATEQLRSIEDLPIIEVNQESSKPASKPASKPIEPVFVEKPSVEMSVLLSNLFGSKYGTGEIDRSTLRSIDDLPEIVTTPNMTTTSAQKPAVVQSEPVKIPESVEVGEFLKSLFGEKYGSGEIATDQLRSKDDLPVIESVKSPVQAAQSLPVAPKEPEIIREKVEASVFLTGLFGTEFGSGSVDNSKLRSKDDLPSIEAVKAAMSAASTPASVVSIAQPVLDDKSPVEMTEFLSGLFGANYGSGDIDQSKLRSLAELPTIESVIAAMNQAVQAAASVKPIERTKPETETPKSKPIEVFKAEGKVKDVLVELFGSKYGTGDVATDQLRSKDDLQKIEPKISKLKSESNPKPATSVSAPEPVSVSASVFLAGLFGEKYGTGQVEKTKLRPKSDLPEVSFSNLSVEPKKTKPVQAAASAPVSEPVKTESVSSEVLSKLFGPSYGTGEVSLGQLRSADYIPKLGEPIKCVKEVLPTLNTKKIEIPVEIATGNVSQEDFCKTLFGSKFGTGSVSTANIRDASYVPKTVAVPVASTKSPAKKDSVKPQAVSEPIRVPIEADAFLRGLFGPNYGTGITDSEPRRSSFKRSSSVRKSVTFTDNPLVSNESTESEPEVITPVEIEDEPADEEFFAKTGNTAYPRESDFNAVSKPDPVIEPVQEPSPEPEVVVQVEAEFAKEELEPEEVEIPISFSSSVSQPDPEREVSPEPEPRSVLESEPHQPEPESESFEIESHARQGSKLSSWLGKSETADFVEPVEVPEPEPEVVEEPEIVQLQPIQSDPYEEEIVQLEAEKVDALDAMLETVMELKSEDLIDSTEIQPVEIEQVVAEPIIEPIIEPVSQPEDFEEPIIEPIFKSKQELGQQRFNLESEPSACIKEEIIQFEPVADEPEIEPEPLIEPLQKSQPILRSPNLIRAAQQVVEPIAEPIVDPVEKPEIVTEVEAVPLVETESETVQESVAVEEKTLIEREPEVVEEAIDEEKEKWEKQREADRQELVSKLDEWENSTSKQAEVQQPEEIATEEIATEEIATDKTMAEEIVAEEVPEEDTRETFSSYEQPSIEKETSSFENIEMEVEQHLEQPIEQPIKTQVVEELATEVEQTIEVNIIDENYVPQISSSTNISMPTSSSLISEGGFAPGTEDESSEMESSRHDTTSVDVPTPADIPEPLPCQTEPAESSLAPPIYHEKKLSDAQIQLGDDVTNLIGEIDDIVSCIDKTYQAPPVPVSPSTDISEIQDLGQMSDIQENEPSDSESEGQFMPQAAPASSMIGRLLAEASNEYIEEETSADVPTEQSFAPSIIRHNIEIGPSPQIELEIKMANAGQTDLGHYVGGSLDSTNLEMSEIPENSAENISDISEEVIPKSKKMSYQERLKQTRKTLAESEKAALEHFSSSDEAEEELGDSDSADHQNRNFEIPTIQKEAFVESGEEGVPEFEIDPYQEITFNAGYGMRTTLQSVVDAGLLSRLEAEELINGNVSYQEIESDLHRWLFSGTSAIAGVYIQDEDYVLTIAEAVNCGLLTRGTGLELLEAQAATGGIIDPRTTQRHSAIDAFEIGLLLEYQIDTIRRAERACRGFVTVTENEKLSLFTAMQRGLVVESRGLRLLEAQIATGGLIDPQAGHRVPIEVAFQRGLFDERMNRILLDPSDDTKGFFDPNTEENLSYLDLLGRCVTDPSSELSFMCLSPEGAALSRFRRNNQQ